MLMLLSNNTARSMTTYLPLEILATFFEQVDEVRDLRYIRTASRTFCDAATAIAFRVLSVTSTSGSAQNFGRLFYVPEMATHVKELVYCDLDLATHIYASGWRATVSQD